MELQDFLSKLSLPQDFTRRGFLKLRPSWLRSA